MNFLLRYKFRKILLSVLFFCFFFKFRNFYYILTVSVKSTNSDTFHLIDILAILAQIVKDQLRVVVQKMSLEQ